MHFFFLERSRQKPRQRSSVLALSSSVNMHHSLFFLSASSAKGTPFEFSLPKLITSGISDDGYHWHTRTFGQMNVFARRGHFHTTTKYTVVFLQTSDQKRRLKHNDTQLTGSAPFRPPMLLRHWRWLPCRLDDPTNTRTNPGRRSSLGKDDPDSPSCLQQPQLQLSSLLNPLSARILPQISHLVYQYFGYCLFSVW